MAWLIIELWRALQDTLRTRQEEKWRDELIELDAEKKISQIRASVTKAEAKLIEAEADLQRVKAGYIWARVPTEEDKKNGSSGIDEESTGKAKAGKHRRG